MTIFEKITATPETLAELLGSLVNDDAGPWDTAFTKQYCATCPAKNCTDAVCALPEVYKDPRKMAAWWLGLEAGA
jgi:hypothetical protein